MQAVDNIKGDYATVSSIVMPWVVCFAASMLFFYEFIQGNMFASIATSVMQDFHIAADKVAYLSSVYYLSAVIFLFISGMILDRFSIKNTLLFMMFLCVCSTFILSYSHSFAMALSCRFVIGIGSAFCFVGPIRLASDWFPSRRMALVTGVIVTMAMTGGMLAQYPLVKLVEYVGWRQALQDVGILGFVMLMCMALWIKEKPHSVNKVVNPIHIKTIVKKVYLNTQYLRAAFYTSLMNMAIAVFGALVGTLYLEQRLGVSSQQAATINGMLFFGTIIGSPLVGWISDKIGLRVMPMRVGVVASLVTLLAILYLPVTFVQMNILFFLLGLFTSTQVISYALVVESSPPMVTGVALSIISILTQSGYIIYQNIYSALLIHHGGMHLVNNAPVYELASYQYASLLLPVGLIIAFLIISGLKETYCRPVEL